MASKWRIYLRDNLTLKRIGPIDKFLQLDLRLVFAGVSKWILDVPATHPLVAEFSYGKGIIVTKDDAVVMSGPIRYLNLTWDETTSTFRIAGSDDTVLLEDEWASPVPAGPPYTASAYDTRGPDVASTIMRAYVDYNIGPSATADRQRAGLVLAADPVIGNSVIEKARFNNLLQLIQSLAYAGGDLGFRIVQSTTAAELVFEVYQPVDRTATVIFSPKNNNLRAFSYTSEAAEANHIIVGGSGEGTGRVFYEKSDLVSINSGVGRIARFRDRRDTAIVGDLEQTADEELLQKATKTGLSITPVDVPQLSFLVHYFLGDKVSVKTDIRAAGATVPPDVTVQDIVREVQILINGTEQSIKPSVGTPQMGKKDLSSMFDRIKSNEARISNVERR